MCTTGIVCFSYQRRGHVVKQCPFRPATREGRDVIRVAKAKGDECGGVISSGVAASEAVDGIIDQVGAVDSDGGTVGDMMLRITLSKESIRGLSKVVAFTFDFSLGRRHRSLERASLSPM